MAVIQAKKLDNRQFSSKLDFRYECDYIFVIFKYNLMR